MTLLLSLLPSDALRVCVYICWSGWEKCAGTHHVDDSTYTFPHSTLERSMTFSRIVLYPLVSWSLLYIYFFCCCCCPHSYIEPRTVFARAPIIPFLPFCALPSCLIAMGTFSASFARCVRAFIRHKDARAYMLEVLYILRYCAHQSTRKLRKIFLIKRNQSLSSQLFVLFL